MISGTNFDKRAAHAKSASVDENKHRELLLSSLLWKGFIGNRGKWPEHVQIEAILREVGGRQHMLKRGIEGEKL
jgi:hypothetical protein